MPDNRPPALNPFTCPCRKANYQLVKVEAGPETDNRQITCRVCDGPLVGREGNYVLKYFLLSRSVKMLRLSIEPTSAWTTA